MASVDGVLKKSLARGGSGPTHYGDAVAEAVRVCVCGLACWGFLRSGTTILCVPIRCRRIHISCKVRHRRLVFLGDRRRPYWPRNQPFRADLNLVVNSDFYPSLPAHIPRHYLYNQNLGFSISILTHHIGMQSWYDESKARQVNFGFFELQRTSSGVQVCCTRCRRVVVSNLEVERID